MTPSVVPMTTSRAWPAAKARLAAASTIAALIELLFRIVLLHIVEVLCLLLRQDLRVVDLRHAELEIEVPHRGIVVERRLFRPRHRIEILGAEVDQLEHGGAGEEVAV